MTFEIQLDTSHLVLLTVLTLVIMGTGLGLIRHLGCAFKAGCLIVMGSMVFWSISILFLAATQVKEREETQEAIISTLQEGDIELLHVTPNLPAPGDHSVVALRRSDLSVRRCLVFNKVDGGDLVHCPMSWDWSLPDGSDSFVAP